MPRISSPVGGDGTGTIQPTTQILADHQFGAFRAELLSFARNSGVDYRSVITRYQEHRAELMKGQSVFASLLDLLALILTYRDAGGGATGDYRRASTYTREALREVVDAVVQRVPRLPSPGRPALDDHALYHEFERQLSDGPTLTGEKRGSNIHRARVKAKLAAEYDVKPSRIGRRNRDGHKECSCPDGHRWCECHATENQAPPILGSTKKHKDLSR